jgi:uncharacterized protein YlxW (UPF0749 family)
MPYLLTISAGDLLAVTAIYVPGTIGMRYSFAVEKCDEVNEALQRDRVAMSQQLTSTEAAATVPDWSQYGRTTEIRVADLETRVRNLTTALGSLASSAVMNSTSNRLAVLENVVAKYHATETARTQAIVVENARLEGMLQSLRAKVKKLESALDNERQWTVAFAGDAKAEMDRADIAEAKLRHASGTV